MNNFWYMEVCRWLPEVKVLLTMIVVMVVVSLVLIMAMVLTTILTAIVTAVLRILVLLTDILRILTINVLLEALRTKRTTTFTARSITVILLEAFCTKGAATLTTRSFTVGVFIFPTLACVSHVTNWSQAGSELSPNVHKVIWGPIQGERGVVGGPICFD